MLQDIGTALYWKGAVQNGTDAQKLLEILLYNFFFFKRHNSFTSRASVFGGGD